MVSLVDLLTSSQPSRMGMIEADPEYDPWSMQAARTRARYPTPGGGILASNASRAGAVGFSDLPGYDEARRQAGNVYAGEDYNPSSLLQMAVGAVGAPGLVGGVPAGAVGSGVGRAKAAMHPPAVATPDLPPIRAYHGSPYDFERFDLSKIGTGEGAQAYGHGLYFAENPATAQSYRDKLRDINQAETIVRTKYREGQLDSSRDAGERLVAGIMRQTNGDRAKATTILDAYAARDPKDKTVRSALDFIQNPEMELNFRPGPDYNPGRMYEVNIRAQPEQFLDWDKRISEQSPQVQAAVNQAWRDANNARLGPLYGAPSKYSGEGLHGSLQAYYSGYGMGRGAGKEAVAQDLRSAGIPGIRYLDQGSRGASGQGTSNYVLFRDDIIDIVRKYGWAGLAAFGISQDDAKAAGVSK